MHALVLPPNKDVFHEACQILEEEGISFIKNESQCRIIARLYFGTRKVRDRLISVGCQVTEM